jgi:hypothetical protein
MKLAALCALLAVAASAQEPQLKTRPAAEAMQRKLTAIRRNAQRPLPAPVTTNLPEAEVNDWFASRYAQLPKGVKTLRLSGLNGQVTANARIDFDEITGGAAASNPLLAMFRGVHQVDVVATGQAGAGQATLHVQSVVLDGVAIPRVVLQLFLENFVRPRYPNVGIDTRFTPGYRIDSATIGEHALTVVQK